MICKNGQYVFSLSENAVVLYFLIQDCMHNAYYFLDHFCKFSIKLWLKVQSFFGAHLCWTFQSFDLCPALIIS